MRPHLESGMPARSPNLVADINHLERIERLATRLVTGMRHLPYEERLLQLGLHSLQRRRLRADLITAFKVFKGLLDIDPNLVFLPALYMCFLQALCSLLFTIINHNHIVITLSVNSFKSQFDSAWEEFFTGVP